MDPRFANLTSIPDGEVNVPLVIIYGVQIVSSFLILWLMDYIPRIIGVLFFFAVLGGYPVSYFTGIPVYEFVPGDPEWLNTFLKVALVVFAATIPTIWFFVSEKMESKNFGRIISAVLVLNILYTLLFEVGSINACSIARGLCCVIMSGSLFLRVILLEQKDIPVIYKTDPEPYVTVLYTPVSTLWVFAYTLWNISYSVAAFGTRTAIQILLLYIGMGYERLKYEVEVSGFCAFFMGYKLDRTFVKITNDKAIHDTPNQPPLGWHFGYTRALTLGGYMAILPYIGMLPFVNDTIVTFQIGCDTEVAVYNYLTLILFIVDAYWAIMEYLVIRGNDNLGDVQVLTVDEM